MKNYIKRLYKKHDPAFGAMFGWIGYMVSSAARGTPPADYYFILLSIEIIFLVIGCIEVLILMHKSWGRGSRGNTLMIICSIIFLIVINFFRDSHFTFYVIPLLLVIIGWIDLMINLIIRLLDGNK